MWGLDWMGYNSYHHYYHWLAILSLVTEGMHIKERGVKHHKLNLTAPELATTPASSSKSTARATHQGLTIATEVHWTICLSLSMPALCHIWP